MSAMHWLGNTSPKQLLIYLFFLLLEFTVMRLTKPTLFTNIPVTCEEKDLPGMALTLFYLHLGKNWHFD